MRRGPTRRRCWPSTHHGSIPTRASASCTATPPTCTASRSSLRDPASMSDGGVDTDALIAAGLYDPAATDAPERLQLLAYLLAQGVSIDELVAADASGSIFRAGLDALIWPDGSGLTIGQVAEAAGMPVETARRAR